MKSPFQIRIVLHYYYSPNEWEGPEDTDFRNNTIQGLVNEGLLGRTVDLNSGPQAFGPLYYITDKGRAYVEMLRAVPTPVVTYSDPREVPPAFE